MSSKSLSNQTMTFQVNKQNQKEIFAPYKILLEQMQQLFAADSIDLMEPISGLAHSLKHRILLALENIKAEKLPAKQYFKESQGLLIQLMQQGETDNPIEVNEYLETKMTLITDIFSRLSHIPLARKNDPILFVDYQKDGWGIGKGTFKDFEECTDTVFLKYKNKLRQVPVWQTCLMV